MIPGHEHGKTVARAGGILFRRVDFGAHRERASRRARGKVCLGTIEARLSELLPFLIGPIRQTGLHPRAAPGVVGGLVAGFLKVVLALCPAQASCKPSSGLSFGSPAGQLAGTHGPFFEVRGVLRAPYVLASTFTRYHAHPSACSYQRGGFRPPFFISASATSQGAHPGSGVGRYGLTRRPSVLRVGDLPERCI